MGDAAAAAATEEEEEEEEEEGKEEDEKRRCFSHACTHVQLLFLLFQSICFRTRTRGKHVITRARVYHPSLSLFFLHFSLLLKFRTNSVLFRSCKLSLVSLSELIKPRRRLFVLYELSRFSFFFLQM